MVLWEELVEMLPYEYRRCIARSLFSLHRSPRCRHNRIMLMLLLVLILILILL